MRKIFHIMKIQEKFICVSDSLNGKCFVRRSISTLVEVADKNLGRYVPPRFSKIGSLKLIFGLKTGVSGTNFCQNLCMRS